EPVPERPPAVLKPPDRVSIGRPRDGRVLLADDAGAVPGDVERPRMSVRHPLVPAVRGRQRVDERVVREETNLALRSVRDGGVVGDCGQPSAKEHVRLLSVVAYDYILPDGYPIRLAGLTRWTGAERF